MLVDVNIAAGPRGSTRKQCLSITVREKKYLLAAPVLNTNNGVILYQDQKPPNTRHFKEFLFFLSIHQTSPKIKSPPPITPTAPKAQDRSSAVVLQGLRGASRGAMVATG